MTATIDTTTTSPATRICTGCGETKPVGEFYRRRKDGTSSKRMPRCRDCDNARKRRDSANRVVRVRARHRAVAELIRRHDREFRALLDDCTVSARREAEQLAASSGEELARLRSGPRRDGQDVVDRIDVGRCPECAGHHDRGHICPHCGAMPSVEPADSNERRAS